MMKEIPNHEVIIIGGSYAGLSAAMSLGRALRDVLVVDSGDPCNKQTPHSHNFITQDGETPANIIRKVKAQLAAYPSVRFLDAVVTDVKKVEEQFAISTSTGNTFTAARLLFATGVKNIMPDVPGFAECWGISVLHCPYCHGYEVRHQPTGILANADMAFEMAKLINNWTKDLTLFTNGRAVFTAEQKAKLAAHQVKIIEKEIAFFKHENGYLQQIVFKDDTHQELTALYARPAFEQHSKLPEKLGCELTDDGYIKIDELKRTSIPGVFAAGDNTIPFRSVANAVAAGASAGAFINHELIAATF